VWIELTAEALAADEAQRWAVRPDCGGTVVFVGTVRDHGEGRAGVTGLEYEAYQEQARPRMAAVAEEARRRWPGLGRVALLHRVGALVPTDTAVVVVASAAHRGTAFEAARFCIDTLKATVPIWKKETWEGGVGWGSDARLLEDVAVGPTGAGPGGVAPGGAGVRPSAR
jgi:molybdopterin synthase catalytic subunit